MAAVAPTRCLFTALLRSFWGIAVSQQDRSTREISLMQGTDIRSKASLYKHNLNSAPNFLCPPHAVPSRMSCRSPTPLDPTCLIDFLDVGSTFHAHTLIFPFVLF